MNICDEHCKLLETLTATTESVKVAHRRLDELRQQTQAIEKMAGSVEHMAKQTEDAILLLQKHNDRLEKLEHAPAENLLHYFKMFVGALVTCGAGVVIGLILKGK